MIRNIKQYLKAISGKIQNVINNQESASNYLVVVVGDTGVGKTTALRKFTQRPFPNHVVPTVAVQFYAQSIQVGNKRFRLHFWDTCSNEFMKLDKNVTRMWECHMFSKLTQQWLYMISLLLLLFIKQMNGFKVQLEQIDIYDKKRLPVLLFGNKIDLCMNIEGRAINGEEKDVMKEINAVFIEGCGLVDNSLEKGLTQLLEKYFINQIVFEKQEIKANCCCWN